MIFREKIKEALLPKMSKKWRLAVGLSSAFILVTAGAVIWRYHAQSNDLLYGVEIKDLRADQSAPKIPTSTVPTPKALEEVYQPVGDPLMRGQHYYSTEYGGADQLSCFPQIYEAFKITKGDGVSGGETVSIANPEIDFDEFKELEKTGVKCKEFDDQRNYFHVVFDKNTMRLRYVPVTIEPSFYVLTRGCLDEQLIVYGVKLRARLLSNPEQTVSAGLILFAAKDVKPFEGAFSTFPGPDHPAALKKDVKEEKADFYRMPGSDDYYKRLAEENPVTTEKPFAPEVAGQYVSVRTTTYSGKREADPWIDTFSRSISEKFAIVDLSGLESNYEPYTQNWEKSGEEILAKVSLRGLSGESSISGDIETIADFNWDGVPDIQSNRHIHYLKSDGVEKEVAPLSEYIDDIMARECNWGC